MGCIFAEIFRAVSGETVCPIRKKFSKCKNGTEHLRHYAEYGEARISCAAGCRKSLMLFVCFLSVTRSNGKVCADDFAIQAFDYGNAFDIFGQGKVQLCLCAARWRHHRMLTLKMSILTGDRRTIQVKFGKEERIIGPLTLVKFGPHR